MSAARTPMPGRLALAETYILVIRDRATGTLTLCETDVGTSLKDATASLAIGSALPAFEPAGVVRLDPASGALADVTSRVLHEIAAEAEIDFRDYDRRLDPLFAAYDVPLPVVWESSGEDENDEHRLGVFDVLGRSAA